jgi:hypothetical protein
MNFYQKAIFTLLPLIILLFVNTASANDDYELVNPSEMFFDLDFENDRFNGVVTEFYNPLTKRTDLYVKLKNTTILSLTFNGQKLDVKNNIIEDGFVETSKYGKLKIGLHGPPPHKVIVWMTPKQKAAFLKLKSTKKQ